MATLEKLVSPQTFGFLDYVRRTTAPARKFFLWSLLFDLLAAAALFSLAVGLRYADVRESDQHLLYLNGRAAYKCLVVLPSAVMIWIWAKSLFLLLRIRDLRSRETMSQTQVEASEFLQWMLLPALVVPGISVLTTLLPALSDLYSYFVSVCLLDNHEALGASLSLYMVGPYSLEGSLVVVCILSSKLCKCYPSALWPIITSAFMVIFVEMTICLWPVVNEIAGKSIYRQVRHPSRGTTIVDDLICYAVCVGVFWLLLWPVKLAWRSACQALYTFE